MYRHLANEYIRTLWSSNKIKKTMFRESLYRENRRNENVH